MNDFSPPNTAHTISENSTVGGYLINEAVLVAFDAEICPFEPAADLLSVNGQQGLSAAMTTFVATLRKLNVDRILRRFNWYERFTGLDLEARIEFDIAAHNLNAQMLALGVAAGRARKVLALLRSERPRLRQIQAHHEELIARATAMLLDSDPEDYFAARLQRRLANLEVLAASDRMSDAQMELTTTALAGTLDRYVEIEKLLFPVWQQHAFALVQSNDKLGAESELIAKFKTAHRQLAARLAV